MEQLNLDHMLTNSLDHLSVHSIVLWTRVGSEKANNIMPEQRTSRALLRLPSTERLELPTHVSSPKECGRLEILHPYLFFVVIVIGDINHVIWTYVMVRRSNAATLRILDNMQ